VMTGPQREMEGARDLEMKTPHPAASGFKDAEPSVYRTTSGLERGV